jgi:hypothetical protein
MDIAPVQEDWAEEETEKGFRCYEVGCVMHFVI